MKKKQANKDNKYKFEIGDLVIHDTHRQTTSGKLLFGIIVSRRRVNGDFATFEGENCKYKVFWSGAAHFAPYAWKLHENEWSETRLLKL